MRAYTKDIFRNISHSKKRFLAIALITLLGVMMFSGLQASCNDLEKSADAFFDSQKLHDIQIQSSAATVLSDAVVTTLNENGIDHPYLLKGSLPSSSDEALLTEKTAKDSGLSVGDHFTASAVDDTDSSGSSPTLSVTSFTVCGIVTDPTDMDNPFGQVSYRSSQSSSDKIFVEPEAVDGSIYTSVVIRLKDAEGYNCYSDEYTDYVNEVQTRMRKAITATATSIQTM